jgi:sigma-E factor negative regulatory protein RseC
MESEARVVSVDGTDALVELVHPNGGCGRCHEAGGCGAGASVLGQMLGPRCATYRVSNSIQALPGERVLVRMGGQEILRVALAVYLLPVVLVVAGAYLAMAVSVAPGDGVGIIGAVTGFVVGIGAVIAFQARENRLNRLRPVLVRIPH